MVFFMAHVVRTNEDLLALLDSLLRNETDFWQDFYENREKGIPFFVNAPDENLSKWFEQGLIKPARVLELGCGPGRNAIYMAKEGSEVIAVDLSEKALIWAKERMESTGVTVDFRLRSVFSLSDLEDGSLDFIYDAGCLHHIPPHRRPDYLALLKRLLKKDGRFGLVCFRPEGGSGFSDIEVYEKKTMKGGLGFDQSELEGIFFPDFEVIEMRQMEDCPKDGSVFGRSFLWVALFQRRNES